MKKQSSGGSTRQRRKFRESFGRAIAFVRIANDLANAKVLTVTANARLDEDGPTGIIFFMPGAYINSSGEIALPKEVTNGKY